MRSLLGASALGAAAPKKGIRLKRARKDNDLHFIVAAPFYIEFC
jgi:hypothetical protein